jgi:hypothetical protein
MFLQSRLNQTRYPTHPLHRAMSVFSVNSVIVGFFDFTSWRDAGALLACSKGMHIEGVDRVMHSKFVQSLKDRLATSQTSLATSQHSLALTDTYLATAITEANRQTDRADDLALALIPCAQCAVECRNGDMFGQAYDQYLRVCAACSEREITAYAAENYYHTHPNNREMLPRAIRNCERCEGAPVIIGRQNLCEGCKQTYQILLNAPNHCSSCLVTDPTIPHYTPQLGQMLPGMYCRPCAVDGIKELCTVVPGEIGVVILETVVMRHADGSVFIY